MFREYLLSKEIFFSKLFLILSGQSSFIFTVKFLIMRYSTIKTILQGFLTLSGGALLNCSLGRDRTGVVCFIIEIIAGFSKEFIVEDMPDVYDGIFVKSFVVFFGESYVFAKP